LSNGGLNDIGELSQFMGAVFPSPLTIFMILQTMISDTLPVLHWWTSLGLCRVLQSQI
jgi:hypothetical protein